MSETQATKSWADSLRAMCHPKVVAMLFLGFSAGIPLLLIFSSLSLWLTEAGVQRAAVTYFSWAALGYSFKFVWAPLVDLLPIPLLTRLLGRRRSWLLLAQLMIMLSISWMAFTNPANGHLTAMAFAAVLLGFSSATQDIVIDAYRIESAKPQLQALMSASYIAGYRLAMLVAGAGALLLASYLGSDTESYYYQAWQSTYLVMAAMMLVGVITTLIINEPKVNNTKRHAFTSRDNLRFVVVFVLAISGFIASFFYSQDYAVVAKGALNGWFGNGNLAGFTVELIRFICALGVMFLITKLCIRIHLASPQMIEQAYMAPIKDFFERYGLTLAWLLLALIGLYRISDIVLGVIANVFYYDMGFTKSEIGTVVKTFGLAMTIAGSFIGGLLVVRFGVMRVLMLGAVLSAITNLLFMWLAQVGHDINLLYIVISADNLSGGIATAAFIAFLSSLTNVSFTAMQYAIFSSVMTLLPKLLGGYSGTMVDAIGYQQFFMMTALMGVPVLLLIILANGRFILNNGKQK